MVSAALPDSLPLRRDRCRCAVGWQANALKQAPEDEDDEDEEEGSDEDDEVDSQETGKTSARAAKHAAERAEKEEEKEEEKGRLAGLNASESMKHSLQATQRPCGSGA